MIPPRRIDRQGRLLRDISNREKLARNRRPEAEKDLRQLNAEQRDWEEEEKFERGPLKMFVRHNAWLDPIKSYVERRKADGLGEDFKYFTFPGPRGIDIGVLWEAGLLKRREGKWESIAICDKESENIDVIIRRVGTFGAVSSLPLEYALNRPEDPLVRFFPVDVVNLDFCTAVLREDTPEKTLTNLETIQKIFDLQRGKGFLLLLTHRVTQREYAGQIEESMRGTISKNLAENEAFGRKFGEVYRSVDACFARLVEFALLGIAKYVAQSAQVWAYSVTEQFVGYYPRDGGTYSMGVNSFVLDPIGRIGSKRYSPRFRFPNPHLANLSEKLVRQTAAAYSEFVTTLPGRPLIDVDSELKHNSVLHAQFRELGDSCMEWWRKLPEEPVDG